MSNDSLIDTARKYFLHAPDTLSQSYVLWAEQLQNAPGIKFGCILDKFIIPLHPGDLVAIVARPGMGKSSFMAYMAKREANAIIQRGTQDKECVIYVSWEQTVEEIEAFFESGGEYTSSDLAWGRVPLDVIKQKAINRVHLPIWTIGESLRHAGAKRPQMTVEHVYGAIEVMAMERGLKPTLICLDYLQIIPVHNHRERRDQVGEATIQAKQLGKRIGCPIMAGVQAGRQVDEYKNPIPTMADAQHSSAIEQTADKQLAVWRPVRTFDPTEKPTIKIAGADYANDDDLFVIRRLKERFESGFGTWAVRFKPQTLEMHDYVYERPLAHANGKSGR